MSIMLRNSDLINKVEEDQVKMLLVTQEPNGPLRWRGDIIRLNAIMGNVNSCSSIKETFKVESKNKGKLLFDDIFVSKNETFQNHYTK